VIGHSDWTYGSVIALGYQDGTHTDPGDGFPWDYVLDLAAAGGAGDQGDDTEEDDMPDLTIDLYPFVADPAAEDGKAFGVLNLPGPARDETPGHPGTKLRLTTGWGQVFQLRVWFLGQGDRRYLGPGGAGGHPYTVYTDNPGLAPVPDGTVAIHAEWTSLDPVHPGELRVTFVPLG